MKRHLWAVSEALLPARHVFDFNQALMDLGAMVCTARKPRCLVCPMAGNCLAFPFTPDNPATAKRRGPITTPLKKSR
jgi:A/G-specific adenine glycosylase